MEYDLTNTKKLAHKPEEYAAIRIWCKNSGSYDYYIEDEQWRAAVAGAPLDALYEKMRGTWVTVSDLAPDHPFRAQYAEFMAKQWRQE